MTLCLSLRPNYSQCRKIYWSATSCCSNLQSAQGRTGASAWLAGIHYALPSILSSPDRWVPFSNVPLYTRLLQLASCPMNCSHHLSARRHPSGAMVPPSSPVRCFRPFTLCTMDALGACVNCLQENCLWWDRCQLTIEPRMCKQLISLVLHLPLPATFAQALNLGRYPRCMGCRNSDSIVLARPPL